jgi:murein DD-endopeptidase MepM/ murein hydrolase activator NlpD
MLLWFNPVLRALGKRLSWAQELSCDQQVLAGRSQHQRQQYAAALVSQLKVQHSVFGAALAFGEASTASLVARVRLIRNGGSARAGMLGKAAVMAMLVLLLGASLVLQPALAWRVKMPPAPTLAMAEPALPAWHQPLAAPRVSSFFGVRRDGGGKAHRGIDFATRTGTAVMATASGTVIDSTDRFERGANYGKVIVIEHANGLRSLYAHLDRRSVQIGERVGAGQVIGLSGATGKVTGAHLHLEVTANSQHIDPARLISGLDQNAFSSALRKRAAPVIH